MKIKLFILFYLILNTFVIQAQNTEEIKRLNITKPLTLHTPILINTTDSNGNKFDSKTLLTSYFKLPIFKDYYEILETSNKYFELETLPDEYAIQFLSFNLASDTYTKNTMLIKSSNMFEVYVDKKKVAEKYTQGEEQKKLPETKNTITLYPNEKKNVIIKILRNNNLSNKELLDITIQSDSNNQIKTNNNNKRSIRIEDNLVGERLTQTSISPNGDFILNKTTSVNEKGEKESYSYLYNLKNKDLDAIKLENGYNWMPSSNLLYNVKTNKDKTFNIITKDPISFVENTIIEDLPSETSPKFLPNEKSLILSESKKLDKRKGDIRPLLSPEDRQSGYLDRNILYLYNIQTKLIEQIFFSDKSVYIDDISKDSELLLISTYNETITQRPFRSKNSYLYNLSKRTLDTIFLNQSFINGGKFSPDNKKIVFLGSAESFNNIGNTLPENITPNSYNNLAYVYDIKTKEVDPITKNFSPSIKNVSWLNSDNLLLNTVDEVYENIYSYNLKLKNFVKLDLEGDVITQFSLDETGKKFSYIAKGVKKPTESYLYNVDNKSSKLISSPMQEIMKDITLGDVENWKFVNKDSITIDGFYHLPPNFDPSKKYPLLVYYYGGTTPTSKTFEHPYSMHYFASLGYVVYTIIPSGAIGYGQEFAAKHVNAWGINTADDIISATKDFIDKHPYIQKDKIGCLGASYGGFMTMYLLTQTNLFKAAIAHAGISSIASYWGEGYWGYSYSSGASANSYPWNNPDLYVKQSPLFNADKVSAPLLLTHGTVDTNVPIGESIQMFTALKILGKPVEFLQIANENHGVANFQKKVDWSHSMGAWFDRWLKNEPKWWFDMYTETKIKED